MRFPLNRFCRAGFLKADCIEDGLYELVDFAEFVDNKISRILWDFRESAFHRGAILSNRFSGCCCERSEPRVVCISSVKLRYGTYLKGTAVDVAFPMIDAFGLERLDGLIYDRAVKNGN
jgi:hypothetical protein